MSRDLAIQLRRFAPLCDTLCCAFAAICSLAWRFFGWFSSRGWSRVQRKRVGADGRLQQI